MFRPMGRYHNAKRLLNRRPPLRGPENIGTRRTDRASDPATLRLRCSYDGCGKTFKAAEHMRCPYCQHQTVVLGDV